MWQLFIFLELEPFFYYFVITKTLNPRNEKWKLAYLIKYSSRKNTKGPMGQQYPSSTIWEREVVVILNIYGARSIFLIFCDLQDTEYE